MNQLATTISRARRLQKLLDAPERSGSPQTATAGHGQPVVAKISTAISSGDYSLQTAKLMAVSAGTIVETGQTVQVRHVGEGAVTAGTVVIPEPCGRLGLCFSRQNAGTPAVTTAVARYQRVMYPILDDDLEQADTNWQLGTQVFPRNSQVAVGSYGYYIDQDWMTEPTTFEGIVPVWIKYLYPMRFRIHSQGDGYWGGSGNDLNRALSLPSPLNQLMFGLKDVGISTLTPGSATHFAPMSLSAITPHYGPFMYFTSHNGGWLEYYTAYVTHARIWIDEVDVTGIYAVGQKIVANGPNANTIYTGGPGTLKAFTAAVHTEESVWVDLWVKLEIRTGTGSPGLPTQVFWVNSLGNFSTPLLHYADPNAVRTVTDDYEFTLASAGPGSQTTITTADGQANWSRIQSAYSYRMTWTGGGDGGWIWFDWNRENVWIQLAMDSLVGDPADANGLALYFPQDSGEYEGIRFSQGYDFRRGVWDPTGVTTFNLAAVKIQNVWVFRYSQRTLSLEDYFTGWPQTIDVEAI